ncbi:MAG: hypothetical protein J0H64_03840, partial [Actinobacteria bacterium]|nr:hypothetical protein [Actinomycetota bacterium]
MKHTASTSIDRPKRGQRVKTWLAGAVTAALAVTMLGSGVLPAQAADWDPASLRITKTVTVNGTEYDLPDAPEVQVGEEFQWNIAV